MLLGEASGNFRKAAAAGMERWEESESRRAAVSWGSKQGREGQCCEQRIQLGESGEVRQGWLAGEACGSQGKGHGAKDVPGTGSPEEKAEGRA